MGDQEDKLSLPEAVEGLTECKAIQVHSGKQVRVETEDRETRSNAQPVTERNKQRELGKVEHLQRGLLNPNIGDSFSFSESQDRENTENKLTTGSKEKPLLKVALARVNGCVCNYK